MPPARSSRWLRLLIPVLLLAAGGAAALFWYTGRGSAPEERYQLEELALGDITQAVTANGTLSPVVLVNVGTQVSGTVRKLYADFNQKVEAGQKLLELDPTLFRAQVSQSEGVVATARAALVLARAGEARTRELFGQGYVSAQDLDQALQASAAARAQLVTARGQLSRDQANQAYSVIRSPVSGVVVSREVDLGQTVAASFQTPTLFKIAQDLARMRIDSNVGEADIGRIKVGQEVRFTVDTFPGRNFLGKVGQVRLNPITQQNVVSYDVVVDVDNADLALLPGMTAYLNIRIDAHQRVLLIPNSALRFQPSDGPRAARAPARGARDAARPAATAWVLRAGVLVPAPVRRGLSDGRYTEVLGGELKAGERVVLEDLGDSGKPGGPPGLRMRLF